MAGLNEVEDSLVETVAEILAPTVYSRPSNYYQPETVFNTICQVRASTGLVNVKARLYRGWPIPQSLQADLKAGISEISVYSVPGMTRLLNQYLDTSYVVYTVPITVTPTIMNNTVTYTGTPTAGQVTGIANGEGITQVAYAMRCQDTDTPTTIANSLSTIIPGSTVSGSTITIPNASNLLARTAGDSTTNLETNYVSQMFDIHIWSPNPQSRDVLVSTITSGMSQQFFLPFADGSHSKITYYRGVWMNDMGGATTDFSCYLRYEIIYPITVQSVDPGIIFFGISLNNIKMVGEFDWRTY